MSVIKGESSSDDNKIYYLVVNCGNGKTVNIYVKEEVTIEDSHKVVPWIIDRYCK
jgi:hypothetical protein